MSKKSQKAVAAADPQAEAQVEATPATPAAEATPKFVHNKKLAVNGAYTPESAITWNISKNPRSAGKATFDRFAAYFNTPTVGAYMAAGGTKGDLLWDLRSGYLSIAGVELGGELQARAPKAAKAAKAPKAPKAAKEKLAAAPPASAEVEAMVQEETID
jgi:hypothetical protein